METLSRFPKNMKWVADGEGEGEAGSLLPKNKKDRDMAALCHKRIFTARMEGLAPFFRSLIEYCAMAVLHTKIAQRSLHNVLKKARSAR
jgi:hypothetical protein